MGFLVLRSSGVSAGPSAPTYVPWLKKVLAQSDTVSTPPFSDFNDIGDPGSDPNYRDTTVSTDITGPFGETGVIKVATRLTNNNNFGGSYLNSGVALSAGNQTWIRGYYYFPTSWCAGNAGGGDSDGEIKFMRYEFANGSRATAKLAGIGNNSCAAGASSPTMKGFITEIGTTQNNFAASPPVIPRDQWVALQWHITHGTSAGTSALEMWVDSTYVGGITVAGQFYPSSASDVDFMVLGNYWNGDPKQVTSFYHSNIIFTKQTPNTTDSGGRAFIHPLTKITDFP